MRFINNNDGTAFNPLDKVWPENAYVKERFVSLRIHRRENHVVADEPKLCWECSTFEDVVRCGGGMKDLLFKAINAIHYPNEYFGSDLKYAVWYSEKHKCMFQMAYSELKANECS